MLINYRLESCRSVAALLVLVLGTAAAPSPWPDDPFGARAALPESRSSRLSGGSSAFVANKGQWDAEALFLSRTSGVDSWIVPNGAVYDFHRFVEEPAPPDQPDLMAEFARGPQPYGVGDRAWLLRFKDPREERRERLERTRRVGHVVRLAFLNTAPSPDAVGTGPQPGTRNYYIGNDPAKWATHVPTYSKAVVRGLYPGIDAVYTVDRGAPRYDLVVHPGADPSQIEFALLGAESVRVTSDGRLAMGTRLGVVEMRELRAFQGSRPIACKLSVSGDGVARFVLGSYDRTRPLTIDPLISSTFLGGAKEDTANAVAIGPSGNAVVCGCTNSADFPTTEGAYDRTLSDGMSSDVFVTWLSASGELVSSTFLGGTQSDLAYGVTVDGEGYAVVCGYTDSSTFPTTSGAHDRSFNGAPDAFVSRVSPSGQLSFSTFLGSLQIDWAWAVSAAGSANTVVVGGTWASDYSTFPTTTGSYNPVHNGSADAFVTMLSPSGKVLYSTFLGGPFTEEAFAVCIDPSGDAIVGGYCGGQFPTTVDAFDRTFNGQQDAFVARISFSDGLVSSTYLGGDGDERVEGLAVDGAGNAVVTGYTASLGFPTTEQAFDRDFLGWEAYVARISRDGGLVSSTFLGGSGWETVSAVDVDACGNAVVCGHTNSEDFPVSDGALDPTFNGWEDAFVSCVSPSGRLLSSTYLGGISRERAWGVGVGVAGDVAVCGTTASDNFPTTEGAFDRAFDPSGESYVARLRMEAPIQGRVVLGDYLGDPSLSTIAVTLSLEGDPKHAMAGIPLGADGSFRVATHVLGSADITVKASHWLARRKAQTWDDSGVSGLVFELVNGDVDGDNAITVFDFNLLSAAFDSVQGDAAWNANADLDGDGIVSVFDYNILSANFDGLGDP